MVLDMRWKLFVFDFDGVLVDSYSCFPAIYELLAKRLGLGKKVDDFVHRAITSEDTEDVKRNFDRRRWWPIFLAEFGLNVEEAELNELLRDFLNHRIRLTSIIEGARELLVFLKMCGSEISIMCGNDGQPSMKKKRIKESGLSEFFEHILIVGEDVNDRKQGLSFLFEKFEVTGNETILIDDKPDPINEIRSIDNSISTAKIEFSGPLKLAWLGNCVSSFKIKNLVELKQLLMTNKACK